MHDQLAWYIAGPVLGACVVAWRVAFGTRLGVTGGFSDLVAEVGSGSLRFDWRGWFAIGILVSGAVFALVRGAPGFEGYGWLTETFTGDSRVWIAPILVIAGILIGYGAKVAGGCTSGNGLSGMSSLSPASLVATATFFGTAIVVSFAIKAVI